MKNKRTQISMKFGSPTPKSGIQLVALVETQQDILLNSARIAEIDPPQ